MEILRTSRFLNNLYENTDADEEVVKDYYADAFEHFKLFKSNKNLSISNDTLASFLNNFNALYQQELFDTFQKPELEEYFCKELRYLLIIDFVISFFKTATPSFDFKSVNTQMLFDFFVQLGDFYTFINFLDVDENFTTYLKYMLTLYCLDLYRDTIDTRFENIVGILDDFFVNEVLISLLKENNYYGYETRNNKLKEIKNKYAKEIKTYNENINYEELIKQHNIDNLFELQTSWGSSSIEIRYDTLLIKLEKKPPRVNNNNQFNNDNGSDDNNSDDNNSDDNDSDDNDSDDNNSDDNDSDDNNSDDYDDYDYDDYYGTNDYTYDNDGDKCRKEKAYRIDKSDPNYKKYYNIFVNALYKRILDEYNVAKHHIINISNQCRINDYNAIINEPIESIKEKINSYNNILIILGCEIRLDVFAKLNQFNSLDDLFRLACIYGNMSALNIILMKMNYNISFDQFCYAANSRNKKALEILINLTKSHPEIKKKYDTYIKEQKTIYDTVTKFNSEIKGGDNLMTMFT